MSAQTQFGFAFDAESQTGSEIVQKAFDLFTETHPVETMREIEVEEVADPPEVIPEPEPEPPTHKELERDGQLALIDVGEWWEEAWKGMPEFIQEDLEPYKTIYVHFENREDMDRFSKIVEQKIGLNTRSIWYPEAEIGRFGNKRYIDALPEVPNDDIEVEEE